MNRLANNWNLKLTALVLAIALWTHVRGEVNPWETATFKVRLDRVDLPNKLIITDASKIPKTINVTLRGPRLTLREMKGPGLPNPLAPSEEALSPVGGSIRASLDFTGARRGEQTVPIKVEHPRHRDVEVIGTNPTDVVLNLDQAAESGFFVRPQFTASIRAAYTVQGTRVEPATVAVSGPSNLLNKVDQVQARINSVRPSGGLMRLEKVPLLACNADGEPVAGVRVQPEEATVVVNLRETIVTRKLRVVADPRGMPGLGYRFEAIEVSPSRIEVSGAQRFFADDMSLPVPVDINGATAPITRQLNPTRPEGLKFVGAARVTVRVRIVPDNLPPGNANFGGSAPLAPSNDGALTVPQATDAPRRGAGGPLLGGNSSLQLPKPAPATP